ncbi:Zinc finger BED domain-containing protein 1 [Holothuria leucospilota]|uniref:Zinc finger BED domain-containing protein 1 n=1 Tax=Holothuria leucospilota TaxID=206669 RepID=A0A9Q1CMJ2_HOLLE|nr:Zinc finger BED domain-containing protein 1 [Holothuria leucospilota]
MQGLDTKFRRKRKVKLCINSGLDVPAISKVLGAASRLVGHFRKSNVATKALAIKQEQMGTTQHKLIQSCKTRWNSTYDMLRRLEEQRWPICAVLSDAEYTSVSDARTFELTDRDWKLVIDLSKCLKFLQVATTALSSEMKPTLSIVEPIMSAIATGHMKVLERDSEAIRTFKTTVSNALQTRFNFVNVSEVING